MEGKLRVRLESQTRSSGAPHRRTEVIRGNPSTVCPKNGTPTLRTNPARTKSSCIRSQNHRSTPTRRGRTTRTTFSNRGTEKIQARSRSQPEESPTTRNDSKKTTTSGCRTRSTSWLHKPGTRVIRRESTSSCGAKPVAARTRKTARTPVAALTHSLLPHTTKIFPRAAKSQTPSFRARSSASLWELTAAKPISRSSRR